MSMAHGGEGLLKKLIKMAAQLCLRKLHMRSSGGSINVSFIKLCSYDNLIYVVGLANISVCDLQPLFPGLRLGLNLVSHACSPNRGRVVGVGEGGGGGINFTCRKDLDL